MYVYIYMSGVCILNSMCSAQGYVQQIRKKTIFLWSHIIKTYADFFHQKLAFHEVLIIALLSQ